MTTITIRHVPPEVRNELAARAARRGQSLQEFMLGECTRLTDKPPLDEVLAQARARAERLGRTRPRDELLAEMEAERR